MASLAVVRAQVESRLPGALTVYERPALEVFPTGISAVDQRIGGLPQSALTQICPAQGIFSDSREQSSVDRISMGKTSLLISLMAQMTTREHFCALVDAGDCFDPASAEPAGVNLARLLWVRCAAGVLGSRRSCSDFGGGTKRKLSALEQAFKAADILVQNGGFSLIAVDLSSVPEKFVRKVPLTTWFRFARVIEKMPAALVFLLPCPAAQSCAGLTLHLACARPRWSENNQCRNMDSEKVSHAQLLSALCCEVEIGRSRLRKPMQSATNARFTVVPQWT